MTFLDTLLGRKPPVPRSAKAVVALGGNPWATGTPLSALASTPQEKAAQYLRAYKVGWFYKAGSKIADDISTLDWRVSDGDMEQSEAETQLPRPALRENFEGLTPIDQFQRLLERPNPHYTGRTLIRKTQVRLDFAGNAAWFFQDGGAGLPEAIYGLSPSRLWPSFDGDNRLIGWVLDRDQPSGGVGLEAKDILWFSTGSAGDDELWGTSVVEAVYSQVPLTDAMARHTGTVLSLGGRLSGMLWPKDRALGEDEFLDAQRAWRNVASDPDAARRLLIFPEPMEYAGGAASPQEIGIPELAVLNRDEILTAFPISPYRLGVPMPGGLNSGEVRREDRRDYWEETIHPRADLLQETIQVGFLSRYEEVMGQTYNFSIEEPNLDDAPSIIEKIGAYKGLVSVGFDPKESLGAVGLEHIKWLGLPALLDPAQQAAAALQTAQTPEPGLSSVANDTSRRDSSSTSISVGKALKARDDIASRGVLPLLDFLEGQRDRVVGKLREKLPRGKRMKSPAPTDWWDSAVEDAELAGVLRVIYQDSATSGLQVVADTLGRIVPNKAVSRVTDDLLAYGGERIADINARTLQAITFELAEGTRRGYSVTQLIEGVPAEDFRGVMKVGMDNGVGVWGDARAETIARTETALSYNRATLDGYKEFRVSEVVAIDGDKDEECADRNGRVYPTDEAIGMADHPNGTLDWVPVLDKSARMPVVVNITNPPAVTNISLPITNKVPAAVVNVAPTPVTVEAPMVKVFNEVQTPDVLPTPVTIQNTVEMPTVSPPAVTVEAPNVTVEAPSVNVTNEVVTPTVNVKSPTLINEVATPTVSVDTTPLAEAVGELSASLLAAIGEMKTALTPLPPMRRQVERDADGRIIGVIDIPIERST